MEVVTGRRVVKLHTQEAVSRAKIQKQTGETKQKQQQQKTTKNNNNKQIKKQKNNNKKTTTTTTTTTKNTQTQKQKTKNKQTKKHLKAAEEWWRIRLQHNQRQRMSTRLLMSEFVSRNHAGDSMELLLNDHNTTVAASRPSVADTCTYRSTCGLKSASGLKSSCGS